MSKALPCLCLALSTGAVLSGCGAGALPHVVDARDVRPGGGTPSISRIRDAGTALVPQSGAIDAVTDGIAAAGELLVIEGGAFGRQPAVTIGGRPTEVLGRTDGGGIVVRVPAGVESGIVDVAVTTVSGVARLGVTVRRLAALLAGQHLRFASIGKDAVTASPGDLAIEGGRALRVDSTGGLAIALADVADKSQVVVVDLGRGTPTILGKLALQHRASAIAVAKLAPVVALVGDGRLSIIDTTALRRPVLYNAATLPKEVRGIRAAELSPDGHVLAVLLAEGNRVVALDVSSPTKPQLVSTVDVLPGERQSLVRDLAFSPDGQTLWVVSGASAETHPQVIPTRVTALKLVAAYAEGGPPSPDARPIPVGPVRRMLAVWKSAIVQGASAPLAIVAGHAPDAQGSAIRVAPEAATVYVTCVKDTLFELKKGPADAAKLRALIGGPPAGMVARAELATGGGPVATTAELLGALALSHRADRLLALGLRATEGAVELGVESVALEGQARGQFTPLTTIDPSLVRPPFALGAFAVQP
jgi:hypothetical protein